eukprot:9473170-Pyramimonas_sp.AAC.1
MSSSALSRYLRPCPQAAAELLRATVTMEYIEEVGVARLQVHRLPRVQVVTLDEVGVGGRRQDVGPFSV